MLHIMIVQDGIQQGFVFLFRNRARLWSKGGNQMVHLEIISYAKTTRPK